MAGGMDMHDAVEALISDLYWQIDQMKEASTEAIVRSSSMCLL
jgi:hypothetical protein